MYPLLNTFWNILTEKTAKNKYELADAALWGSGNRRREVNINELYEVRVL